MSEDKPIDCTCDWPRVKVRNLVGHPRTCEAFERLWREMREPVPDEVPKYLRGRKDEIDKACLALWRRIERHCLEHPDGHEPGYLATIVRETVYELLRTEEVVPRADFERSEKAKAMAMKMVRRLGGLTLSADTRGATTR